MGTKKLAAICIALAGCASYPPPNESLATSVGAVHGAQEAGAEQLPDAALHLRLAQEENEKAKQLMADGDNERATYMTERARADAELSLALAHEERARERAHNATASLDKLTNTQMQGQEQGAQQQPAPAAQPAQPAQQPVAPAPTPGTP